jgi:type IV secretory pathway TrbF-like protein
MATKIDAPTRYAYARMVGLGHGVLYLMGLGVVISSVASASFGYIAYREATRASAKIERYVIYLDDANNVVNMRDIKNDWVPKPAVWTDFAATWVRYVRVRPKDNPTQQFQRKWAGMRTEPKLIPTINKMISDIDELYGSASVDVGPNIDSNIISMDGPDRAIVSVSWTETLNRGAKKESSWNGTITIENRPPPNTVEVKKNPLGLYVVNVQIKQRPY